MSEWIKTAKVGDKVVCVDGRPRPKSITNLPVEGMEYTIRAIAYWNWPVGSDGIGVFVKEISRGNGSNGMENPWKFDRFRPVEPRPTSITIFTDMLTNIPEQENAA